MRTGTIRRREHQLRSQLTIIHRSSRRSLAVTALADNPENDPTYPQTGAAVSRSAMPPK